MKKTLLKSMCLILALVFSFGGLVACGNKDDDSDEAATVIITFDYSAYEGVVWDEDFDEEMEIEANQKIGDLPKPTLAGYTFKGWYEDVEDTTTKLKKTSKFTEDATYYALFAVASTGGETGGETGGVNCAAGVHSWSYEEVAPTCTEAGKRTGTCKVCGFQEPDAFYPSQNPALGHLWVEEGKIGDGWTIVALARKRTCLREDCGYFDSQDYKNITANATMAVTHEAGGWPDLNTWPGFLKDGDWDKGSTNGAPKGGQNFSITLQFITPQDVDQVAMSCSLGYTPKDGYGEVELYIMYAGESDFRPDAQDSKKMSGDNTGVDNAICFDLSENELLVSQIKIVVPLVSNGTDYFYEVAVAQIPEEE